MRILLIGATIIHIPKHDQGLYWKSKNIWYTPDQILSERDNNFHLLTKFSSPFYL